MTHWFGFAFLFFLLVFERLAELRSANRNSRRLMEAGGREFGAAHYPLIVAMHVAFFVGLVVEFILRGAPLVPFWPLPLAIFIFAQLLRLWARLAMGSRWTARIVAVPGEILVTRGPFRFLRHPIYVAVAMELFSIPLLFGLYLTCFIITALNALMLLLVRIPEEEAALHWAMDSSSLPLEGGVTERNL